MVWKCVIRYCNADTINYFYSWSNWASERLKNYTKSNDSGRILSQVNLTLKEELFPLHVNREQWFYQIFLGLIVEIQRLFKQTFSCLFYFVLFWVFVGSFDCFFALGEETLIGSTLCKVRYATSGQRSVLPQSKRPAIWRKCEGTNFFFFFELWKINYFPPKLPTKVNWWHLWTRHL